MKNTLLLCMLLACSQIAPGQYEAAIHYRAISPTFSIAVDTLIQRAKAANPSDTSEGGDVNALTRWKDFMGNRICNNVVVGGDMFAPLSQALGIYMSSSGPCTGGVSNWQCLGPFTSTYDSSMTIEYQGRINAIWVDPADSNIILAGADAGGLWKSTDDGKHWHNISDGNTIPGTMGVSAIAVNPINKNIIFLALSSVSNQYTKSYGYSFGLAYTTDGGVTWVQDTAFNILMGRGLIPGNPVINIAYMPGTQKLFAIYNNSKLLYNAGGPGSTWTDITPGWMGSCTRTINDLKFSKQTPIKAVACIGACGDTSQLWTFDSTGTALTDMKMYLPAAYTQTWGAVQLSISSGDTAYIEFIADSASKAHIMLMRTSINSFNLSMVNTVFYDTVTSPNGVFNYEVSPANSNIIYASSYNGNENYAIWKSIDGGHSFPFYNTGSTLLESCRW